MSLSGYRGTRLDQIWNTIDRRPAYRVCIWNPRLDDLQSVVLNRWNGPRYDITHFVEGCGISMNQVFENSENAISSRATIRVVVDDKEGLNVGTRRLKVTHKMFKDGTPIAIYEGDRRIYNDDWPPIFTGTIIGYPGADAAVRGKKKIIQIQAFGRAQAYQRQQIVGISWPINTDFGNMAVDIATEEMNLSREEILFGEFGETTSHIANALAQVDKMKGLYEITRVVGRRPYFNSRGYLVTHDTSFTKPPAFFFDEIMISSMKRVQFAGQSTNSVSVTGLDSQLSEVRNPYGKLVEVDATVGFWDSGYDEAIWWSDDHTKRAKPESVTMHVVTDNGYSSEASFDVIDEFHVRLVLDTGYAPTLVVGLIGGWALFEYLAIDLEVAEMGFWLWVTRLLATALLLAALYVFTRVTRWKVEFSGDRFENVFQEIRSIAVLKGTKSADVNEREETIHWISDMDKLKAKSKELLTRELVKAHSYEIILPSNPLLEVDDIIELEAPNYGFKEPSRFYVTEITRTYKRGPTTGQMSVKAWFCGQDLP